jgi:soluble lytic murein transglycosylase-like protein
MVRFLYIIGLCGLALPVWSGENIVLQTGFRLPADRHEVDGGTIRIFSGEGVTEMPVSLVARVELVESPAADPAPVAAVSAALQAVTPPLASPKPVPAELTPAELAEAVALKYALPSGFVAGVMRAESGFNVAALSPKGAIGLMQLMPDTARDLGVDPTKPSENADAGARYLRDLLARYEDKPDQVVLALAAYNAGPGAVDKYHGVPPYRETREYILRVLKAWNPVGPINPGAEPAAR